jgi:hypothetical protein
VLKDARLYQLIRTHGNVRDRVVFGGDPATREFIAFWMTENRVVAGINVNVSNVDEPIQYLIRDGVAVDDRQLADLDIPNSKSSHAPRTAPYEPHSAAHSPDPHNRQPDLPMPHARR